MALYVGVFLITRTKVRGDFELRKYQNEIFTKKYLLLQIFINTPAAHFVLLKIYRVKIVMVCLGNICRSPLAEGIMRAKLRERQLPWEVDSAGTSGWHNGEPPHEGSIEVSKMHGIDISRQKSRKFIEGDFESFDVIFVMDRKNRKDVLSLAKSEKQRSKVKMILEYNDNSNFEEVPDPYYDNRFELVYQLLEDACENFLSKESV